MLNYVILVLNLYYSDLLDEAKDYHLMPERRQQMKSFRTQPRCCTEIVEYIVAVGGLTSSGKLYLVYSLSLAM